jgi:hypothetical protein
MTTLTMRYIKGDFALPGLAHQRDRSDLQAPRAERRAVKRAFRQLYQFL